MPIACSTAASTSLWIVASTVGDSSHDTTANSTPRNVLLLNGFIIVPPMKYCCFVVAPFVRKHFGVRFEPRDTVALLSLAFVNEVDATRNAAQKKSVRG